MAPKIRTNVKHNLEDIDELRHQIRHECQQMLETVAVAQEWAEENHDTPNLIRLSQLNRKLTHIHVWLTQIERKVLDGLENRYRVEQSREQR